ncbi:hypothetical protein PQ469_06540 [Mucilaginibacter sp. KACC 22773]|uniref:hypothetical protein n=1 Tax=Mucilaginibacter sp. KACC 22773 TaxID=3025671 RepID=UPI002366D100|nr:hypothetical protein [Mucilaginibacter sp. KACC 22773]WDF79663.1 hypothetical protein PQ469_06540 [Mucilaginibacter sp. KACC 22773]
MNTDKESELKKKKPRRSRGWIIAGGIALLLSCLVTLNWNLVTLGYYYIFTADHFNEGDKVYISKSMFDVHVDGFSAFRLIRPSKRSDIDTMNVGEYMKRDLIKGMDTTLQSFAKPFNITFDRQDMIKQKSAFIGTFVKTSFVNVKSPEGEIFLTMMYVIKPNKKVFHVEDAEYKRPIQLPQTYNLANDNIYMYPPSVSSKELKTFSTQ